MASSWFVTPNLANATPSSGSTKRKRASIGHPIAASGLPNAPETSLLRTSSQLSEHFSLDKTKATLREQRAGRQQRYEQRRLLDAQRVRKPPRRSRKGTGGSTDDEKSPSNTGSQQPVRGPEWMVPNSMDCRVPSTALEPCCFRAEYLRSTLILSIFVSQLQFSASAPAEIASPDENPMSNPSLLQRNESDILMTDASAVGDAGMLMRGVSTQSYEDSLPVPGAIPFPRNESLESTMAQHGETEPTQGDMAAYLAQHRARSNALNSRPDIERFLSSGAMLRANSLDLTTGAPASGMTNSAESLDEVGAYARQLSFDPRVMNPDPWPSPAAVNTVDLNRASSGQFNVFGADLERQFSQAQQDNQPQSVTPNTLQQLESLPGVQAMLQQHPSHRAVFESLRRRASDQAANANANANANSSDPLLSNPAVGRADSVGPIGYLPPTTADLGTSAANGPLTAVDAFRAVVANGTAADGTYDFASLPLGEWYGAAATTGPSNASAPSAGDSMATASANLMMSSDFGGSAMFFPDGAAPSRSASGATSQGLPSQMYGSGASYSPSAAAADTAGINNNANSQSQSALARSYAKPSMSREPSESSMTSHGSASVVSESDRANAQAGHQGYNAAAAGGKAGKTNASQRASHTARSSATSVSSYVSWNPQNEVIGKYRIKQYLGHGSYGQVYQAEDETTKEKVAIKRILNMFDDMTHAKRLLRELRILRSLVHENVIEFREIIAPPDINNFVELYLVFEFVDTDLQKLINSNQHFTNLHIQFFLYQILLGLRYIHSAGIIHRDLKPANLLVNADCSLKVLRTMHRTSSFVVSGGFMY